MAWTLWLPATWIMPNLMSFALLRQWPTIRITTETADIMMEHQGIRWGYVFLRAPNFLSGEDREKLMTAAVEMYLAGEDERDIESVGFEGRVYTERRYEMLGEFGGQRFDVDLETTHGRDTATFLVNEQTGGHGAGLGFSRN